MASQKGNRPVGWRSIVWLGLISLAMFWLDEPVYRWVHDNYNYHTRPIPDHLKLATRLLRSLENWGENVYILAVAFAMWRLDSRRRSRLVALALAAVTVTLAVEGVKRLTGRERPEVSLGKSVWHGPTRWREGGDYQSFPSGHTASAAAYSGALAAFYPPLRPMFITLAVGCGANRIWKERHFLSDCWVAGLIGFWIASSLPGCRPLQPIWIWLDHRLGPRSFTEDSPVGQASLSVPALPWPGRSMTG